LLLEVLVTGPYERALVCESRCKYWNIIRVYIAQQLKCEFPLGKRFFVRDHDHVFQQSMYKRFKLALRQACFFKELRPVLLDILKDRFREEERFIGGDDYPPRAGILYQRRNEDVGVQDDHFLRNFAAALAFTLPARNSA
jgi:hypothetical protein